MEKAKARRVWPSRKRLTFDAKAFLESAGAARRVVSYSKGKTVFSQGQPSDAVRYIQKGGIKDTQIESRAQATHTSTSVSRKGTCATGA
jgi:hypothetical protein